MRSTAWGEVDDSREPTEFSATAFGGEACEDCWEATQKPHHGFTAACKGCCARAASRSPHYRRYRDNGVQDREYRGLLTQFDLKHADVVAAAQSDAMSRNN